MQFNGQKYSLPHILREAGSAHAEVIKPEEANTSSTIFQETSQMIGVRHQGLVHVLVSPSKENIAAGIKTPLKISILSKMQLKRCLEEVVAQ